MTLGEFLSEPFAATPAPSYAASTGSKLSKYILVEVLCRRQNAGDADDPNHIEARRKFRFLVQNILYYQFATLFTHEGYKGE